MFLTRDPSSETTAGVRVVEVGVAGETPPPTDEAEAVETFIEVEGPEADDITCVGSQTIQSEERGNRHQ